MIMEQRFRINAPLVATQTIEGETILIHFETGCYYSTNATGSAVLSLIQQGRSFEDMVSHLVAAHGGEPEDAHGAVAHFLSTATSEDLLVPLSPVSDMTRPDVPSPNLAAGAESFPHPSLEKFEDLQDLLLLDPIHDVDQAGWPMAPRGHTTEPASAKQG